MADSDSSSTVQRPDRAKGGPAMRLRSVWVVPALVAVIASSAGWSPPSRPTATVSESGIWGGGFINVVARDWNATSHFLTGGDDSGFHATTFSTNNWPWATSNAGMTATLQMSIAAVAFRRFQPGGNTEVYAGYGAGTGGMLKSSNGGQTWSQFGITSDLGGPKFQAHSPGNAPLYNGQPYPRPTGNL